MRLTDSQMYARFMNSDASFDGRFFTGVLSTGIYCLPSCKARKPRRENIRFFPTAESARTAGLRACKKCHPDDFARGADPVLESIEALVSEIRSQPAAFPDARAIVRRSGFGATRAFELFKQHYHATPADVLLRARLAAAKTRLLASTAGLARIAADAGFESLSVFHKHFRRANGLTPAAYRALRDSAVFELALPPAYPLAHLLRSLGRDPHSVSERLRDSTYTAAIRLADEQPALLALTFSPASVRVTLSPASPSAVGPDLGPRLRVPPLPPGAAAHALAVGLLGLDQDAAAFARLTRRLGLARLTAGRENLRISQLPSVFDGLLWAIIGQQINLPFTFTLRRRLFERIGHPLHNGFFAPPTPAALAALEPADLLPLQFSRQKASYLITLARTIVRGELDLSALPALSATRAERTLLALHGFGPWSVNYVMMRALAFPDCVPLGDTGVTTGLKLLFPLEERPDLDATRRLMTVFSPHRSLATAHLWQLPQPPP